jgi:hypothetical protein
VQGISGCGPGRDRGLIDYREFHTSWMPFGREFARLRSGAEARSAASATSIEPTLLSSRERVCDSIVTIRTHSVDITRNARCA